MLSTKALASLLSTMLFGAFRYPLSWLLVVVLVGTSVAQIKYLNKALMRFQSKVRGFRSCMMSLVADVDVGIGNTSQGFVCSGHLSTPLTLSRCVLTVQEVIPTQFVFFSLAAIIGSAVLYQEVRDVPFAQFVNFAFGVSSITPSTSTVRSRLGHVARGFAYGKRTHF